MRIRLLSLAQKDIDTGRRFYQEQRSDLDDYFLDSIFSDIDSLLLYAGIHQQVFGFHRALSKRFPTRSTIGFMATTSKSGACSIAGRIRTQREPN